jgi:hypothetical protein
MNMGGADGPAPPIFMSATLSLACRTTSWHILCLISGKSSQVVEDFCEKTFPCRDFVRHDFALYSANDPLRSKRVRRGGARGRFTSE